MHVMRISPIRFSRRLLWLLLTLALALVVSLMIMPLASASGPAPDKAVALFEGGFLLHMIDHHAMAVEMGDLSCHGGATGGNMMDIPPPHNAKGHTWHHPDCQLTDIILHGSGEMGEMMRGMMDVPENTPRMPAWKGTLTEEEVAAILAYIKTWWSEEQRELQASATQRNCQAQMNQQKLGELVEELLANSMES